MKLLRIVDLESKKKGYCPKKPIQLDNIVLDKLDKEFNEKYTTDEWKKKFAGKTVWMINSTAEGGGVAEMMSWMIEKWGEIGCNVNWAVINVAEEDTAFFDLTKLIHNMVHGDMNVFRKLTEKDRELFEKVNKTNAEDFINHLLKPQDIVVIHDPQPSPFGMYIKKHNPKQTIFWRSHIGLHYENEATKEVWGFLKPYLMEYDEVMYSTEDYVPDFLKKSKPYHIVHPSISPYNIKNVEMDNYEIMSILGSSNILYSESSEKWEHKVTRVNKEGKLVAPATKENPNFDFMFKPILLEISRWDKLKGWVELIKGFSMVKQNIDKYVEMGKDEKCKKEHREFLEKMVLVLGGPDPAGIQDDPEGLLVFNELKKFYGSLDEKARNDIFIFSLPMNNKQQNAKIVNALQRISTVVVQNSIQEGFGLTCTEALWKGKAVLGSTARGLMEQITHGKNGILTKDPKNPESVAEYLNEMCRDGKKRKEYALNGKKSVLEGFLVWPHCSTYLDIWKKFM